MFYLPFVSPFLCLSVHFLFCKYTINDKKNRFENGKNLSRFQLNLENSDILCNSES